MNLPAALPFLIAGVLALAVLLAWFRLARWQRHAPAASRSARGRVAALCVLQLLSAVMLYFTLLPPRQPSAPASLVVLTADADARAVPAALRGAPRVALPEGPTSASAERVPDLATALRQRPGTQRLHVIGAGLDARDLPATEGRAVSFDPAPLPRGVSRLDVPARVTTGGSFTVGGRVEGAPRASVELRDPSGQRIDRVQVDGQGEFRVSGSSRLPGPATFSLQVVDGSRTLETLPVPLWSHDDPPPRVWLIAGAPNAELKYLRRWATDAGIALHAQISVGGGLQLGDAPLPVTRDTLRRFDLLVLDERSAAALGTAQRAAVTEAVREGLGVMLRITGPVPQDARRWLGLQFGAGGDDASFKLARPAPDDEAWRARRGVGTADAPVDADAVLAGLPALTRRTTPVRGEDLQVLLRDDASTPLAWSRTEGRGRVVAWPLTDTFRLVLAGHPERHGELWSQAFATLARAQGDAMPALPSDARVQQRATLCGLAPSTRVIAPNGRATVLQRDPATGDARCAAFWPDQPGWHQVAAGGVRWPLHVRAAGEAPGIARAALREQTRQRVGNAPAVAARAPANEAHRGPAWPWLLAWLASAGVLWWLERSRRGRPSPR